MNVAAVERLHNENNKPAEDSTKLQLAPLARKLQMPTSRVLLSDGLDRCCESDSEF